VDVNLKAVGRIWRYLRTPRNLSLPQTLPADVGQGWPTVHGVQQSILVVYLYPSLRLAPVMLCLSARIVKRRPCGRSPRASDLSVRPAVLSCLLCMVILTHFMNSVPPRAGSNALRACKEHTLSQGGIPGTGETHCADDPGC